MDKFIKENKITTTIVIVLLVVFGIVYLQNQPTKTENQNPKISSVTSDIDLQTKCSSQAKAFFDYLDIKSEQSAELSNHYNAKLNKCFALIKTYNQVNTGGVFSVGSEKDLYDAIERKTYGSYSWMSEQNKKYWDVPPLWCDTYPDGNKANHQVCKSEEEFDSFVSNYMEN